MAAFSDEGEVGVRVRVRVWVRLLGGRPPPLSRASWLSLVRVRVREAEEIVAAFSEEGVLPSYHP